MRIVTFFVVLFSLSSLNPYIEHRFDDESVNRVQKLFPYVRQVENNTNIKPETLLGIIYNESNAHPWVVGDRGKSFGLGQIRCRGNFSWLNEIQQMLTHVNNCRHLLKREEGVYSVAYVLEYHMDRYKDDQKILQAYHIGKYVEGYDDSGYINRVRFFGSYFSMYYYSWKFLKEMGYYVTGKIQQ